MENKEKELFGITPPPTEEKTGAGEEKKEAVDTRYKVYGQNIYVADKEIIEYYQMSAKLLCFANLLVGRFDDKGNYIIAKEIKRDLVAMDKEVSDEGPTFFKATNLYMKKNFYYYVSLSKTADGKGKASLYLYEYVGDYMEKDFISSHVADFVDELDASFKDKVRHSFNLVDVDVPNDDRTTPALAVLMQKMIDEHLRSVELIEMACQVYVIRVLKNFEKSAQGRKIIEKFKEELAKVSKGKLSYIKQKAILDRVVNGFGGYEILDVDQQTLQTLMQELTQTFNETVTRKAVVEVIAPEKKEEKKTASKSASKKPAAKKAGGGGAKKPAKKAAGKKDSKDDKKKKGGGVSVDDLKKKEDKKKEESTVNKLLKKIVTVQDIFAQRLKEKGKADEDKDPIKKPDPDDAEDLDVNSKRKNEYEDADEDDAEGLGVSSREADVIEKMVAKNGQGSQEDENDVKYKGLSPEQIEKLKAEEAEREKLSKMTPQERAEYERRQAEEAARKRREAEEQARREAQAGGQGGKGGQGDDYEREIGN